MESQSPSQFHFRCHALPSGSSLASLLDVTEWEQIVFT